MALDGAATVQRVRKQASSDDEHTLRVQDALNEGWLLAVHSLTGKGVDC